jgi:hypothetical protein
MREKKGQIIFDNKRTPPALSAIFKKPRNNARIPINGMMISITAFFAVSIIPSVFRCSVL